jgi:hypothetical protein
MKRPLLFERNVVEQLQEAVKTFLNAQQDFISLRASSPRSVGDAVQSILEDNFAKILAGHVQDYSTGFARRAMADIAFQDIEGFYHVVDVKTHRLNSDFNMPNLISVERLSRFYESDEHYLDLLMISYTLEATQVLVEKVIFVPIELISWQCLTIGALGWGQIQIANANRLLIEYNGSRKQWMLQLCERLMEFYPAEIAKITNRIGHFEKVRQAWLARPDE